MWAAAQAVQVVVPQEPVVARAARALAAQRADQRSQAASQVQVWAAAQAVQVVAPQEPVAARAPVHPLKAEYPAVGQPVGQRKPGKFQASPSYSSSPVYARGNPAAPCLH